MAKGPVAVAANVTVGCNHKVSDKPEHEISGKPDNQKAVGAGWQRDQLLRRPMSPLAVTADDDAHHEISDKT